MEHSIPCRWTPDSNEYKEVATYKKITAKEKMKLEIEQLVKERIFYLNTIAHHAGI